MTVGLLYLYLQVLSDLSALNMSMNTEPQAEVNDELLHVQATNNFDYGGWCFASSYVEQQLTKRIRQYVASEVSIAGRYSTLN